MCVACVRFHLISMPLSYMVWIDGTSIPNASDAGFAKRLNRRMSKPRVWVLAVVLVACVRPGADGPWHAVATPNGSMLNTRGEPSPDPILGASRVGRSGGPWWAACSRWFRTLGWAPWPIPRGPLCLCMRMLVHQSCYSKSCVELHQMAIHVKTYTSLGVLALE